MDFIIDTAGDDQLIDKDELTGAFNRTEFENADEETLAELLDKVKLARKDLLAEKQKKLDFENKAPGHKTDAMLDKFFDEMGWGAKLGQNPRPNKRQKKQNLYKFDNIDMETGRFKMAAAVVDVEQQMKKSVIGPGLEKEITLPEYNMSDRRQLAIRKKERKLTKGPSWFNLAAPEVTEELKADLQVLKMRSVLDPKHFYKKNDMEVLPKYFQVGKVMDSALVHQNERLTRKQRKRTIVDELLADADASRYTKKRYNEIVEEKRKTQYKTYIKDKRTKSKEQYRKNKQVNKKVK